MSFTIQQSKTNSYKPGISLVFIDRVHFKNSEESDFYYLSQEFNANVLDLFVS